MKTIVYPDGNWWSCAVNFYFPRLLTCRENYRGEINSNAFGNFPGFPYFFI
jgi:hypothetical protein